jgi:signal peptidase
MTRPSAVPPAPTGSAGTFTRTGTRTGTRIGTRIGRGAQGLVMAVATAWLSLVGGLLWWADAPVLLGWQPRLITSGSMAPTIRPGDVVLTAPVDAPAALVAGRVVAVTDPSLPEGGYLHRVVGRDAAGNLITQGDANPTPDHPTVNPDRLEGEMRLLVPRVGLPLHWLRQGELVPPVTLVMGTALALAALRRRTPPERAQ